MKIENYSIYLQSIWKYKYFKTQKYKKAITMEKGAKIIVDYKVKGMLLELATYPTIKKALEGKQDTPQCVKIREKALELGGMEITTQKELQNEKG